MLVGGKNGEYEYAATSTFGNAAGAVTSVFGRTGVVTAQSGDYSTSLVTEGSNLYYTAARALAAFITNLAATSSVASITTLPSLSLPYSQLTGVPAFDTFSYPFINNATSSVITFSNGITANVTGNVTGNAGTATALAANGTNCSAGSYPLGVDASGNVENCTVAAVGTVTAVNGTAGQITSSGGTTPTLSLPNHVIFPGNFQATNSTTTNATTTGSFYLSAVSAGGLAIDSNHKLYSGATTTAGTGLSYSGNAFNVTGLTTSQFTSAAVSQWTNDANYTTLGAFSGTFPITYSAGAIGFGGLSTTTNLTQGQLPYVTGKNTFGQVATGTISGSTGLSVTAGQSVIGSGLTITNTGVTSNVAGNGISVSAGTGAVTITNTIGYPFLSNATSTLLFFNGGAFFSNSTSTNATTTGSQYFTGITASRPLYVDSTGKLTSAGSGTSGNCVNWGANNTLGDAGAACGTGGGTGLSTTTPVSAGNVLVYSSTGPGSAFGVATGTVSAGSSAITVTSGRSVIGGSLSIDCAGSSASQNGCLSSTDWSTFNGKDSFAYPFLSSATSSPLMLLASTTIGNGSVTGGLTVSGTATTSNLINTSITSALALFDANRKETAYAGSSNPCSANQAPTTLSAVGALGGCTSTFLTAAITDIGTGWATTTGPKVTFATSTTGTDFTITNAGTAMQFNLPVASAANTGKLSSTDWSTFNNKQATIGVTWPITLSGTTVGFNGLSTSTAAVQGNIPYFSGVNTFANVATGTISGSTGLAVTAGQSVIGSGLTITNTGVTSNVAGSGISVSGSTGAVTITNTIGYPFPSNSTSTLLSFLGNASTTQLSVFNKAYFGTTATTTIDATGNIVIPSGSGLTITGKSDGCATFATGALNSTGSPCGSGAGGTFSFTPTTNFGVLSNATGTPAWFQQGLQSSSTIQTRSINVDAFSSTPYQIGGVNALVASSSGGLTLGGLLAGAALIPTTTSLGHGTAVVAGNTAFGYQAMQIATSTEYNTAIGYQALQYGINGGFANSVGSDNTAIGYQAMASSTIGSFNTCVGAFCMLNESAGNNITGGDNAGFGYNVMPNLTSGLGNTAIGDDSLGGTLTGSYNVGVGYIAGQFANVGYFNTFVGGQAGAEDFNDSANTVIGGNTLNNGGQNLAGYGNIFIGVGLDATSSTEQAGLNIGGLLFGSGLFFSTTSTANSGALGKGQIGVGTTSPWARLSVMANNGDTNQTLFAIGSSTASAITTLFSVSNIGTTTLGRFGTCNTTRALTTDSGGNITCGAVTAQSFAYPFGTQITGAVNATSSKVGFTGGILATASSTIGDGTQQGGLTVSGGATTTGDLQVGPVGSQTSQVYPLLNVGTTSMIILDGSSAAVDVAAFISNSGTDAQLHLRNRTPGKGSYFRDEGASDFVSFEIVSTDADWKFGNFGTGDFSLLDSTNGKTPFFIQQNSPPNALNMQNTGYIGLSTSTPAGMLSVQVGGDYAARAQGPAFLIGSTTKGLATTTLFMVATNGTTTLGRFGTCGSANALQTTSAGVIQCGAVSSDPRLKDNMQPLTNVLGLVKELHPISFNYKPEAGFGTQQELGFNAKEVQAIFPQAVETMTPTLLTPDGTLELKQPDLLAVLWQAVLEQQKQIDSWEGMKTLTQTVYVKSERSVEENWQWAVMALLALGFAYQQMQIRRLKK